MLDLIIAGITCVAVALVVYHHLLYPLILRWVRKTRIHPPALHHTRRYHSTEQDEHLPSITIVIPAYNEAAFIAAKIFNLATLDYPANKLSIVLACDGCSDETAAIARHTAALPECADLTLDVIEFTQNRGKVAVLNAVIKTLHCDIVALSDVSALISVDALLIGAAQFSDPQIGVVNSHYQLLNPGSEGEKHYWRYQSDIKTCEASLGATLGAHGAFYLFRRTLFAELAGDTINDDFILPMQIVAQGFRAAHDTRITALELESASTDIDRRRRLRISAGNLQQLLRLKHLLLPRYKGVAFAFASGKALRVLMPYLMILAYAGSGWLALTSPLFLIAALGQSALYAIAAVELLGKPRRSPRFCRWIGYLVSGHVASLLGSLNYIFSSQRGPWKRASEPLDKTALEGK